LRGIKVLLAREKNERGRFAAAASKH
jgi:hypothetical protein